MAYIALQDVTKVYKTGEMAPPIDRGVNRMISIASYNWVELAALEYIEVKMEL